MPGVSTSHPHRRPALPLPPPAEPRSNDRGGWLLDREEGAMASGILAAIAALVTAIYSVVGQQEPSQQPTGPPDRASIEQRVSELKQAIREFVEQRTASLVPDREAPQQAPAPQQVPPIVPAPPAPARGCSHTQDAGPGWATSTTTCTSTSASGGSVSVAQSVTSSSSSITVQTDVTR